MFWKSPSTRVQYFLALSREKSLECHSVAEIYTAATWQVTSKCSFLYKPDPIHTFWRSKSINSVILSPHCFRDGQLQLCIINKTLKAANITSVRKGKTEWYREIHRDQQWEREKERETGDGEESTSVHDLFPRGERGMLSGTSTTSHMRFLKDAWPRAEAGSRTCDRSSAPVHLNKLPMPCCRCIPFRQVSQSFIRHKSLPIQII